ncbi:hypothetical protein D3C78_1808740 [compost metagenome]
MWLEAAMDSLVSSQVNRQQLKKPLCPVPMLLWFGVGADRRSWLRSENIDSRRAIRVIGSCFSQITIATRIRAC